MKRGAVEPAVVKAIAEGWRGTESALADSIGATVCSVGCVLRKLRRAGSVLSIKGEGGVGRDGRPKAGALIWFGAAAEDDESDDADDRTPQGLVQTALTRRTAIERAWMGTLGRDVDGAAA